MADNIEMTPVDANEPASVTAVEPPKANPLMKPGLKLPPKTGLTAKLKLPPKPGFGTGLKLPPKTGATIISKPVIRKPGAGMSSIPKPVSLPKPIATKPAASVDRTTPAPASPAPATPAPASPAPASPLESLKAVTQNLKGVTQTIPQQAILHKTGIIADAGVADSQKEASKHKTARISLSDAMGVAPVREEHAPMKTIRIKRPINIPGSTSKLPTPQPLQETGTTGTAATASAPASTSDATVTQRKTLKITRPGAVRPTGRFGTKTNVSQVTTVAKPQSDTEESQIDDIADIPEMPAVPPLPAPVVVSDVPAWATTLSTIIEVAACVTVAALVWYLYKDAQLPTFCGGLGWAV